MKEGQKVNYDFVQLYRDKMDELPKMAKQNFTAFRIFMFVAKNMDRTNSFMMSVNAMAEMLDVSRQSIWKANRYLQENHYIHILHYGKTNIYIANPEIVWTTYSNNKRYCEFYPKVIFAETETEIEDLKDLQQKAVTDSIKEISFVPEPKSIEDLLYELVSEDE